jgi:hypothetical protein
LKRALSWNDEVGLDVQRKELKTYPKSKGM